MRKRTCASSIYTATYAQMIPEFGESDIVATLGLSTFVFGSMLLKDSANYVTLPLI